MCDTLCLLRDGSALFAKNSDRPVAERQLLNAYPARSAGGVLETQYLTIDDTGAIPAVLSQPTWLWGAEHGVNAFHVAIGNEKVWGTSDPYEADPGLIGMDLVRLGLERGRNADEAIDVMTSLLERHGQGGIADASTGEPYWSSFLVVDPVSAWVLETCGRTWAARPVEVGPANLRGAAGAAGAARLAGAAISNRITIRTDWTRASTDVAGGADFDQWRSPDAPTGHADRRLQSSRAYLDSAGGIRSRAIHATPSLTCATTGRARGGCREARVPYSSHRRQRSWTAGASRSACTCGDTRRRRHRWSQTCPRTRSVPPGYGRLLRALVRPCSCPLWFPRPLTTVLLRCHRSFPTRRRRPGSPICARRSKTLPGCCIGCAQDSTPWRPPSGRKATCWVMCRLVPRHAGLGEVRPLGVRSRRRNAG